jgi:hypothetical protein
MRNLRALVAAYTDAHDRLGVGNPRTQDLLAAIREQGRTPADLRLELARCDCMHRQYPDEFRDSDFECCRRVRNAEIALGESE